MNHYLLRRKYRIVTLILVTGAIYLCFQIFSFKVLNFSHHSMKYEKKHNGILLEDVKETKTHDNDMPHYRDGLRHNNENRFKRKPPVDENKIQGNGNNNLIFDKHNTTRVVEAFLNSNAQSEVLGANSKDNAQNDIFEAEIKTKHTDKQHKMTPERIRGTHVTQTEAYKIRSDGTFQCLQSKELVPYSSINDDYCDCADSSDEPGTSACPQSKFYCTFQDEVSAPQFVLGSRVGDGVCDCCDGSDEWEGHQVFPGVHITGKQWTDILHHAPCENHCAAMEKSNQADENIRRMGQKLKAAYIQAGRAAAQNSDLYGPDSVFYQLSATCFDITDGEYKYTLCPFKSVTQQKFPAPATNIGQTPNWQVKSHGVYVLKMEKGSVQGCPGGKQRSTVITFICGLQDRILKIVESEKCTYSMTFSSPAAC